MEMTSVLSRDKGDIAIRVRIAPPSGAAGAAGAAGMSRVY